MSAASSSGVWPGMPWIRSSPALATPARAQAAEGRGRVRLRGPAEHGAQLRREALRAERDADAGGPRRSGSGAEPHGRRPRGVLVVGVLRVGLDGDLRVRREVRPEELEQPLEPLRPQQARRAAAEVERVEAAHVVRRPLPLPLGGERVHVRVEPAGGLRPGPPAAPAATGTEAKSQ